MRQPNRPESSWCRFFNPFVGDSLRRRQGRRNQRFSLEPLESHRLLSTINEYPVSLVGGEITTEGGNLWITETNGIGSFSPSRPNNVQVYSQGLPTSPPPGLEGITTGPDNNIWFTESKCACDRHAQHEQPGSTDPELRFCTGAALQCQAVRDHGRARRPWEFRDLVHGR